MRRCTPSSASLACLLRSRRRFKRFNDGLRVKNRENNVNYGTNKPKSKRHSSSSSALPKWHNRPSSATNSENYDSVDVDTCNPPLPTWQLGKGWDMRRRQSRVNGADIYVARTTKNGMGPAKPCWRCLEWCRWAGVKRVFHWDSDAGGFDVVKVSEDGRENYETRADMRLFSGMVS